MAVTIEDVAIRAKVSKGSVSRILNGKHEGYALETRRRVLDTATEMGYQANALSRALWTGQTHTIALWMMPEESYSPYYSYWQHCVQRLVDKSGYRMITETLPTSAARQTSSTSKVYWPVDGILACNMTPGAIKYLHSIIQGRCPIVIMQPVPVREEEGASYANTDVVLLDHYAGACQAVEHLLQSGCRRVGFVAQPYMVRSDQRGQAYCDAMGAVGKPTEPISIAQDTRSASHAALRAYIEHRGCPDGLFCANDEVAIGCAVALQELGIRVPDDVLLVGFDGLENARFLPSPISSVSIPLQELTTLSWQMLLQRIQNPALPTRQQTLTTQLEIRASSQR